MTREKLSEAVQLLKKIDDLESDLEKARAKQKPEDGGEHWETIQDLKIVELESLIGFYEDQFARL